MPPLRIFAISSAFLPYRVTATMGLPQHLDHADVLVVARSKRDAMQMIEPLRLRLGRDYRRLAWTRGEEATALWTAGLAEEAAVYAHPGIWSHATDRYLVRIKPGGETQRVCSMRDLHLCVDLPVAQRA